MSSVEFVFNDSKERLVFSDVTITSFDDGGVGFSMRAFSNSRPVPEYTKLSEIVKDGGKIELCMDFGPDKIHDVRRVFVGDAGAGHLKDDFCSVTCLFRNWG